MKKKSFTLIELLVVIALIAVLSGMLLPSLGKVKENGKKINCISNQKQLMATMILYLNDFNDTFKIDSLGAVNMSWTPTVTDGASYFTVLYSCGYMGVSDVVFCPAMKDSSVSNFPTNWKWNFTYNVLGYRRLTDSNTPNTLLLKKFYTASYKKVKKPATFYLFADTTRNSSDPHNRSTSVASTADDGATVYEAHNKILNSAYLDGHAVSSSGEEFGHNVIMNFQEQGLSNLGITASYLDYYGSKRTVRH